MPTPKHLRRKPMFRISSSFLLALTTVAFCQVPNPNIPLKNWPALLLAAASGPTALKGNADPLPARIKAGTKVAIIRVDGKIHRGKAGAIGPQGLSIQTATGSLDVPSAEIAIIRAAGPFGDFHTIYAPWANLSRVPIGENVRIIRTDLSQVRGRLDGVTEAGLSVLTLKKSVFVARQKIRKAGVLIQSHAKTGRTVGEAVGFFAVLAALVAAASQSRGEFAAPEELLEGAAAGTGAAGSAIARLFDVYQTVYKAPEK
jgi:hypothetical protein